VTPLFRALQSQHRAVLFAFLLLAAAGIALGLKLPAAILPEVTFPRITLIADSGERDTDEMLRGVTMPLEQSIRRVPGLHEMRSTTSRGSTEINLNFDWGSDMDLALSRVQALASSIRDQLPAGTSLDARLMSPTLFPVIGLSLTSPRRSQIELRDLAELQLRPALARLPGVSEVVLQGGRKPEVRVTLDVGALQARSLTVSDVADAVARTLELRSLGLKEANRELYLALVDARPHSLEEVAGIPIPTAGGAPVPLGSLGQIELAEAPQFTRYAARPGEAVLINLLRQQSASTVTLADALTSWLASHRSELPPDVSVGIFYDQADLIRASIGSVRDGLLVGGLLAILIIAAFIGSPFLGALAAVVLPGSVALTLLGLGFARQSLNLMTLGGIAAAIGLVLDDAIVIVEHLAHEGARGRDRAEALAELAPTVFASSFCTLAIFVPFGLLGGLAGAFFRVLAVSIATMLSASLVLSLTLLPHLAGLRRSAPRLPFAGAGEALVSRLLRHRRAIWIGVACVVLLGAGLGLGMGSGFLPSMDEGSLILDYFTPAGTSLEETIRMLAPLERQLDATPEIVAWSRRTGNQLGFFITEPNHGDYVLRLKGSRHRSGDEVADDLRQRIGVSAPGIEIEFGQLVEDVIGDLTTSPQPIEVRLITEDRALGQRLAREAAAIIERVPGVVDVRDGVVISGPNLLLTPNRNGSRLGIDAPGLTALLEPRIAGVPAGQMPRVARVWPVRLTLQQAPGDRLASLLDTEAPMAGGGLVRLADVATPRLVPGDAEVQRADQRSVNTITARLSGRDLGSTIGEIQRLLRAPLASNPGVGVEYAGQYQEQQSSFQGLLLVLALASSGVLLILLVSFRSWRQSSAVLGTALASLAGVFVALRAAGETFNLSSFVGAIMVVGIVAENAVFVVAEYRRRREGGADSHEAARLAATRRLRPILMTTLAGIAALTPLLLGWGAGTALLRPLALAVTGGFALSAPLLLLFLPSLLAAGSDTTMRARAPLDSKQVEV
jgi:multidrug efflux pump subunit AcrB